MTHSQPISVVMMGATGAVGSHVAHTLASMPDVGSITLLGRRPLRGLSGQTISQHVVDVMDDGSYADMLPGHGAAVCTLGVGEPSKISREEFVRLDKDAALAFASACKQAGMEHFALLGSVGANPRSRSFYLRIKGELEDGLKALDFVRLSLFRPSLIVTPTNRYGLSQAVALAVGPKLAPLLVGPLRKYRGIRVDRLGRAIAMSVRPASPGTQILHWDEIESLAEHELSRPA